MSNGSVVVSLDQYLDIVHRHRVGALRTLITGVILSLLAVVILPRTYTSSSVLALNPSQVPAQYFSSSAPGLDFKSRVQALQHEILNPARLGSVIEALNLYPRRRARNDTMADLVASMITPTDIAEMV